MKKPFVNSFFISPVVVFLMMASTALVSRAGSIAAPYEIGTWEGFRPAAISYTFDDNVPNQYSIAVPMFHQAGFKITLFTVINYWTTFTWSMAQTAASYGDEIGSHTVTHPSLNGVSPTQLTNELANSQSTINSYITNQLCVTLAYPNCAVPTNEALVAQYYIGARTCSQQVVPSTPPDFMQISSFICGNSGSVQTLQDFTNTANSAIASGGWCVYLIHSIDINDDYSPLPSATLQASVNFFSTNQNTFWVETFGNVVRYIQERNASSVTETANTGSSITLQVTNNLNNSIFNYPITLRRPLPTNWTWAAVTQNGATVPTQIVTNNSQLYVMFDVVPNGGDVTIAKIVVPGSNFQLVIPPTAIEGQGVLAGQGGITINPAPTNDLVVNLTSSNTNKVTVPASVVIPTGQTNAVSFDLTIVDDGLLDGDQSATITAVAIGYGTRQSMILVSNIHTATLTVTLPATATKGAGTLVNAGHVSASSVVAANYTVNLASSDTSKLVVPSTVVIPTGQTSAVFNVTVPGNTLIDGPQIVTMTAHVPRWTDGSASMTILDNNPPPDHFVWSVVPSPQFVAQPFQVTNITAQDINNYRVNYMLPVTIGAWAPGTAPATNTVLGPPVQPDSFTGGIEYTLGYSFTPSTNLVVTSFRYYFGDKVSLWTDNGVLLASQNVTSVPGTWVETPLTNSVVLLAGITYRIGVHGSGVNWTAYFDDTLQATFTNGTINAYWWGSGDVFPNSEDGVTYYVDLRYGTNVVSVPVSPAVSGNFTNGVWAGHLAVLQPAANVTLQSSIPGHSGQSVPFNVLNAPGLGIAGSGGSVVISWPVAPGGFSLEETHNLSAGSIWTAVPGSPSVVGGLNIITNTPTPAATFYRLIK